MRMETAEVASRTARGVVWAYGSYVGGRALVLLATAVLARLLTPADFGLVALALIFIGLLETVKDLGLAQSLMVAPEAELEERAQTAFVFSVAVGALLAGVVAALSPVAAAFFDEPELVGILSALGANFLLRALGSTHYALAQKRIDFRRRSAAEFADVLVRGSTGIGLALSGAGAWSLVAGYLAGTVALTTVLWILVPWRPSLRPRLAHLRQMLGFGGTLTAIDVASAAVANVDYLFVGRVLGTSALGLYALGYRLPELLVYNLSVVAGMVLFPAFAALDRSALKRAFLVSLRYTLMLALPIATALAILAEPFIFAAFGDQWSGSVPAMQVLSLFALAVTVAVPAGTVFKAIGRPGIILWLALPRAVVLVIAIALFVDEGIVAVAACQAAAALLFDAVELALASRLLEVTGRAIMAELWPLALGTAVMGAALIPIDLAIASPWLSLAAAVPAGVALYGAVLWLFARDAVRGLLGTLSPRVAHPGDVLASPKPDAPA